MKDIDPSSLADSELMKRAGEALGGDIISMERIGNGRNSRVYRAEVSDGRVVVLKHSVDESQEGLDRIATEHSSLRFLWDNGFRSIPRSLVVDVDQRISIHEYVEGSEIRGDSVTANEIDAAVNFIERLKSLAGRHDAKSLPPAAEACFSVRRLETVIRRRRDRLMSRHEDLPEYKRLLDFIKSKFDPAFNDVTAWSISNLERAGIVPDRILPEKARTLSPSDFGFHNALRRSGDGGLVFLDFEYFGWDDPAKLVSDFLLHPAMSLADDLKKRFVDGAVVSLDCDDELPIRLKHVYPLYGLKWVMILLNEFVSEDLERRRFAARNVEDASAIRARQLMKAERLLDAIVKDYRYFPYV